jgi:hypothetical protein
MRQIPAPISRSVDQKKCGSAWCDQPPIDLCGPSRRNDQIDQGRKQNGHECQQYKDHPPAERVDQGLGGLCCRHGTERAKHHEKAGGKGRSVLREPQRDGIYTCRERRRRTYAEQKAANQQGGQRSGQGKHDSAEGGDQAADALHPARTTLIGQRPQRDLDDGHTE